MKHKMFLLLVIAVLLAQTAFASCETMPVHVQGAFFGGQNEDSIPMTISFQPEWFETDNTVYHADLAAFSALLSADVYFREKDLTRGTVNRVLPDGTEEEYDHTCLLRQLGFTETRYVESFKEKEYAQDSNDSVTMALGHMRTDKYDLYAVAFRGCYSIGEWNSIFDTGSESKAYGEHPEWVHPERLKGLDIAAERAKTFLTEFRAACDDPSLPDCILFTGHSRGGCLANLIGADAEKIGDARVFTYTFNTDNLVNRVDFEARTVFNIFDENDLYTDLMPFGEEPFFRYGTDLTLPLSDHPDILQKIADILGRDDSVSVSREDLETYRTLFGQRFPGRAMLYDVQAVSRAFPTLEAAEESRNSCLSLIGAEAGLGLEDFCEAGEITEADGRFAYTFTYTGAALLRAYSIVLGYGQAAHDAVIALFAEDAAGCAIADFLMDNAAVLTREHRLLNSYGMTEFLP